MPLIQVLNSKANIKKNTNQDLPFAPQQPVIASYYAVSTAAQTTIANLGFSIDQSNTDQFFLFVDGKLLRLGASNDYVFSNVGSDNTSSSITFNASLIAGWNIQAFKMGLKKESEFLTDNRFTSSYEWADKSFQGWVSQSPLMLATVSTGTPAPGTFYSSIIGRTAIPDLSQDLKSRMGIDRIMTQAIYDVPGEAGPNGERVFGVQNDTLGQIRYVGTWSQLNSNDGNLIFTGVAGAYVEITFYGTGLNYMTYIDATARGFSYSVDGGSTISTTYPTSASGVLGSRNYAYDIVLPVVAGLALGVHTVKLTALNSSSSSIYGFEILNESSSLKTNPGVGYIQGKKSTTSAQSVQAYNSSFESGTLGTRGGHVVVYQKADGTIAKAVTPPGSQLNLTSADHSNEEVARTYFVREFGSNRSDDFNTGFSTAARGFTLDDGTTTLVCDSAAFQINGGIEGVIPAATGTFLTFTFVGTGCDVVKIDTTTGTLDTFTVFVDGTSVGSMSTTGVNGRVRTEKLVSGLPYGTHTVRLLRGTASIGPLFNRFVVYQPKKPTVPAGAIELAEYHVMANYVANAVVANDGMGSGILRKNNTREFTYVGTWSISSVDPINYVSGFETFTSTNGSYLEYTFFGTGFEFRGRTNTSWSATNTVALQSLSTGGSLVTLNSTNFPGLTTSNIGTGFVFNYSTGNLSLAAANTNGGGISVNGLTLGLYKVRVTCGTSNTMSIDTIDPITPIYSPKPNSIADLQNTLTVGSCGISDSRKNTPSKDLLPAQKAWSQAVGVISSPTTTSQTPVPLPDMSVSVPTRGGPLDIEYYVSLQGSAATSAPSLQVYVDGSPVGFETVQDTNPTGSALVCSGLITVQVAAGVHKVDLYWRSLTGAGTCTAGGNRRLIRATER